MNDDHRLTFKDDLYKWLTEEPDYGPMMERFRKLGEEVRRKQEQAALDILTGKGSK